MPQTKRPRVTSTTTTITGTPMQEVFGTSNGSRRRGRGRRGSASTFVRSNPRSGGFINVENKFVDYPRADDAFATDWATMQDGTVKCISAVAQGDGESNRDGRVYHINSIHLKFTIAVDPVESNTDPPNDIIARVVMVLDKQTNGAELTATDVMSTPAGIPAVLGFRELQYTSRFRVLMDKQIRIPRALMVVNEGSANLFAHGAIYTPVISFNKKFKKPIRVVCTGTTAVIGSIQDNSIHVIGTATSADALLNWSSRCRFSG